MADTGSTGGSSGMPWDTVVGLGTDITKNLIADDRVKKEERKMKKLLANAPKYNIAPEAFETQALARSSAFGQDRAIQTEKENLAQQSANAAGQARDVSNNTSDLLSAISAINRNQSEQSRALTQDQSAMGNLKMQQLFGVNSQMIDEKDKQWNYNENMPFQMKVAAIRDKIQQTNESR